MLADTDMFKTIAWCFTIISLGGAYLNVQRNRWGFFLWIISNSFWTIRNFYIEEYAQAVLFSCFLYLAIKGFISWKEEAPARS